MVLSPPALRRIGPPLCAGAPRIIVADDDNEMRTLIAFLLRRDGYEVEQAENGEMLVARIAAELDDEMPPLDLIVTDVRMPALSGLDLLELLRRTDQRKPVILMTAFPDDLTRKRALAFGAVLFDKPFDTDDLRTAVMNLVGRPE